MKMFKNKIASYFYFYRKHLLYENIFLKLLWNWFLKIFFFFLVRDYGKNRNKMVGLVSIFEFFFFFKNKENKEI